MRVVRGSGVGMRSLLQITARIHRGERCARDAGVFFMFLAVHKGPTHDRLLGSGTGMCGSTSGFEETELAVVLR